ncbi:FAD-dependent monooxygenase [Rhodoplanes sp. TEM]|uniref:FAD-dependent monooxygenase n=1 Tax=Rhodoplanes tepidamans TaxID=200616 RepID=A0ABT5JGE9_RHOTP|nr:MULTISPECIES: FAD-dependent monooxygenase [Rhodoplanes]MDC7788788.1 FAD-dependent monooxygenase [Rhodoplanes tepidamans]MDC7984120.1 FAD-dependent monooxygenase [Rhodoplanes sp. TEM]MDQ0356900.1 2-polyprenyl-6-methoxyphenol hydroxylase-like FAD-dependent oxidoreductase [Rhodoplanes tepidamans]
MSGPSGRGRRALIVGGSMSGLLTGLLLRRRGWDVEVCERVATALSGRGAGIVAQDDLIARLRGLGLDTRALGVAITTRQIVEPDGSVSDRMSRPQTLTAWERLWRLLRDAFPAAHYHAGRGLAAVEQSDTGVVARFLDGGSEAADLLVGADGIRSTVRYACDPAVVPEYAGYVAWRSLLAETDFPPAAHAALFERMTFCLPPGEQFLGYPVAGPDDDLRSGHRRYNIVWYRPADEAGRLRDLLTDATGTTHAISIPPPLIRRTAIAELMADARRLLAPQLAGLVALMEEPILQPIYDLEAKRLAFGRIAIVGDAACVARPHVAAGVAKAADDAAALVDAVAESDDVPAALRAFEAARLPVNRRIVERARHLGAYLQATQTAEEQARSREHGIPHAVMAETAVLDFLHEA